jgi:hypothetical protein
VDARSLPASLPWTLTARPRTIAAGAQREVFLQVRPKTCAPGKAVTLRSVPLRARVGGHVETASIALAEPVTARCPV